MYVFGCLQSRGGLCDNAVGGWIELRNRLETSITVPNVLDLFATVDACDEAWHLVNATLLLELFFGYSLAGRDARALCVVAGAVDWD